MDRKLIAALGAACLVMSQFPAKAWAQETPQRSEAWVRLDRSTPWAWGVERKTAFWQVSDRYVWTIAIAPEPRLVEDQLADYVIFLHKFNCNTLAVTGLAAYAVRTGQSKTELKNPGVLTLPVNEQVEETICSLGGEPGVEGPSASTGSGNAVDFAASVVAGSTYWDELWLRDARAGREPGANP